jgi:hypothetical protein
VRSGWIIRIIGVAALVAVGLAATAFAGGRPYQGALDSDYAATVSLKVKRSDHARSVTSFVAHDFIISCEEGVEARLGSAQVRAKPGTIAVRRGRFSAKVVKGPRTVAISGHFSGSGQVNGKLHYTGLTTVMVNGQSQSLECESETLGWHASRAHTSGRISASTP